MRSPPLASASALRSYPFRSALLRGSEILVLVVSIHYMRSYRVVLSDHMFPFLKKLKVVRGLTRWCRKKLLLRARLA